MREQGKMEKGKQADIRRQRLTRARTCVEHEGLYLQQENSHLVPATIEINKACLPILDGSVFSPSSVHPGDRDLSFLLRPSVASQSFSGNP